MIKGKLKVLDLFCGAGGFSKGFEQAGFNIIAGVDNEQLIERTYSENHPGAKFYQYDISEEILDLNSDIIIGSPPCQGYSSARGTWNYSKKQKQINLLPLDFARWVMELKPNVALMENVAGFMTHHINIREKVFKILSEDYNVIESVLQSSHYGVPQSRKRYFLMAISSELNTQPSFPEPNGFSNKFVIKDALNGLPKPKIANRVIDETEIIEHKLKGSANSYQSLITPNKIYKTTNHIAKKPSSNYSIFLELIPQGKAYRSDRLGSKYISIWEIAKKFEKKFKKTLLNPEEQAILEDIASKRINPKIKTRKGKKQEGYVPLSHLKEYSNDTIQKLIKEKWLKTNSNLRAVDFTAKAGHWRRFYRTSLAKISPTILTGFPDARMFIHPTENRGFSLREGARIQTFPDDFKFYGSFSRISRYIGNAVPPLLARTIANHLFELL